MILRCIHRESKIGTTASGRSKNAAVLLLTSLQGVLCISSLLLHLVILPFLLYVMYKVHSEPSLTFVKQIFKYLDERVKAGEEMIKK